jgi:beta-phosphoglucomutase-like phosphatase (HAD superfamily)
MDCSELRVKMILGWIFDLDGTLVKTEKIKAVSYARAALELCPLEISEEQVIDAYKEVVGRSRQEVAKALMARFELEKAAEGRMQEFGVRTPWQAFIQIRLRHYEAIIADPEILLKNRWPHTMHLLQQVREASCKTALATMSRCAQANHVLRVLGLVEAFDFIATRDDVEQGKPDPEIYNLVLDTLDLLPEQCVAVEDSPSGVQAALAAGVKVIAVTTPFTREALHTQALLSRDWVVDNPDRLLDVVGNLLGREKGEV